jgi:hypothetical protein
MEGPSGQKSGMRLQEHELMRKLSTLRENWDEVARWEMRLLREQTISESAAELEALHREFKKELDETDQLYRRERLQQLAELQARLRRLNDLH